MLKSRIIIAGITFLLLGLFPFLLSGQTRQWINQQGDTGGEVFFWSSTQGEEGDFFVAGSYINADGINLDYNEAPLGALDGTSGTFIAKLNSEGEVLMMINFGSFVFVSSMDMGPSGELVVYGDFSGTVNLDPDNSPGGALTASATGAIFFASYDSEGDFQWAQTIDALSQRSNRSLAVDENSIYLSGYIDENGNVDPAGSPAGEIDTGPENTEDLFVAKYSLADGSYEDHVHLDYSANPGRGLVLQIANDGLLVAGNLTGSLDINPKGSAELISASNPDGFESGDALLLKYDEAFGLLDYHVMTSSSGARAVDMVYDPLYGMVYVFGEYSSDLNAGGSTNGIGTSGIRAGFLVRLRNDDLLPERLANYTGPINSNTRPEKMVIAEDGFVYISHNASNAFEFQGPFGTSTFPNVTGFGHYLSKIDPNFNAIDIELMAEAQSAQFTIGVFEVSNGSSLEDIYYGGHFNNDVNVFADPETLSELNLIGSRDIVLMSVYTEPDIEEPFTWVGGSGNWNDLANWEQEGEPASTLPNLLSPVLFDESNFSQADPVITLPAGYQASCLSFELIGGSQSPQFQMEEGSELNVLWFFEVGSNWSMDMRDINLFSQFEGNTAFRSGGSYYGDHSKLTFHSGTSYRVEDFVVDVNEIFVDGGTLATDQVSSPGIIRANTWYLTGDFYLDIYVTRLEGDQFLVENAGPSVFIGLFGVILSFRGIDFGSESLSAFFDPVSIELVKVEDAPSEMYLRNLANVEIARLSINDDNESLPFYQVHIEDYSNLDVLELEINGGVQVNLMANSTLSGLEIWEVLASRTQPVILSSSSPGIPTNIEFGAEPSISITDYFEIRDVHNLSDETALENTIDLGGNSGWEITTPPPLLFYWVNNGGNWDDFENHWALSSGGTPGTDGAPLFFDDVIFDANSFTSTGQTVQITQEEDVQINSFNTLQASNNPSFQMMNSEASLTISGVSSFGDNAQFDLHELRFVSTVPTQAVILDGASLGENSLVVLGGNNVRLEGEPETENFIHRLEAEEGVLIELNDLDLSVDNFLLNNENVELILQDSEIKSIYFENGIPGSNILTLVNSIFQVTQYNSSGYESLSMLNSFIDLDHAVKNNELIMPEWNGDPSEFFEGDFRIRSQFPTRFLSGLTAAYFEAGPGADVLFEGGESYDFDMVNIQGGNFSNYNILRSSDPFDIDGPQYNFAVVEPGESVLEWALIRAMNFENENYNAFSSFDLGNNTDMAMPDPEPDDRARFLVELVDFSSQSVSSPASNILLTPTAFPNEFGDQFSWSPTTGTGTQEYIVAQSHDPIALREFRLYEYGDGIGSLVQIFAGGPEDDPENFDLVWDGFATPLAEPVTSRETVFHINNNEVYQQYKLVFDASAVSGTPMIDAFSVSAPSVPVGAPGSLIAIQENPNDPVDLSWTIAPQPPEEYLILRRLQGVEDYFIQIGTVPGGETEFSHTEPILEDGTYEYKVLGFGFGTYTPFSNTVTLELEADLLAVERVALETLYTALNGESWEEQSNWNTGSTPGIWFGIDVNPDGTVQFISLPNNGLTGNLPDIWESFGALQSIDLSGNAISGVVPASLGNLSSLQSLNLSSNQIEVIPSFTGLGQLSFLSVANNRLEFGELAGNSALSIDEFIYAPQDSIGVSSDIEVFLGESFNFSLSASGEDNAYRWTLNGAPIPGAIEPDYEVLAANLEDSGKYILEVQNPGYPDLTLFSRAQIVRVQSPLGLIESDSLALVDFYQRLDGPNWINNEGWLEGPANTWWGLEIGPDARARKLLLGGNNLSGPLPASFFELSALDSVQLFANILSGELPDAFDSFTNLLHLDFGGNQLTGLIPPSVGSLVSITGALGLANNNFSGPIPEEVGNLSNATFLWLDFNQLTGMLPESLSNMESLVGLYVQNNSLEGPIPTLFNTLPNLRELYVHDNDFTSLPDFSNSAMEWLIVQENRLDFASLEPNIGIENFNYIPQDSVGTALDTLHLIGEDFLFEPGVGGSANGYQWFKDGELLEGSEGPTLLIENAQIADEGDYVLSVTNDIVDDLTLVTLAKRFRISSLVRDSLALVSIYQSTDGANWLEDSGWLSGNLENWFGVDIADNRVVGLSLPNNNLQGNMPRDIRDIGGLEELNLAGNELRQFPNFRSTQQLERLNVIENRLQFADLEGKLNIPDFEYLPQRRFAFTTNDTIPVNESILLEAQSRGASNSFQWFFNGEELIGETRPHLRIDSIRFERMGPYYLQVTSPTIPDLILRSRNRNVWASAKVAGMIQDPSQEPLPDALVSLLRTGVGFAFDSLGTVSTDAEGNFEFEGIVLGNLVLGSRIPLSINPNLVPTYLGNTVFWENADTLFLRENVEDLLVRLQPRPIEFDPAEGDGSVLGFVENDLPDPEEIDEEEQDASGNRQGGRLLRRRVQSAGVSLSRGTVRNRNLEDEFDWEFIAYTETDEEGDFSFGAVPDGTYLVNVQYPGVPMDQSTEIIFELGGDEDESTVELSATVTTGGIVVEKLRQTGIFRPYLNKLVLYPNPTQSLLHLQYEVNRPLDDLEMSITNMEGKQLYSESINHHLGRQSHQWSLEHLSPGIYLFKIRNRQGSYEETWRIIRE